MKQSAASAVLSWKDLSVSYGSHAVLDGCTGVLGEGERVGLLGRNGAGKSTLLKVAAGLLDPDRGEIALRRGHSIGFLTQECRFASGNTVREVVLSGASRISDALERYQSLPPESDESAEWLSRLERWGAWTLESRVRSLMTSLSVPDGDKAMDYLSGGEVRRVFLCRALVGQPDLLILDEPTNHLDSESIEWLEQYLSSYPGACLFVTHDRHFLDRVATRILELGGGAMHSHAGNYSDYLLSKSAREAAEEALEERRRKLLKRELSWMRSSPGARRTKSIERIRRFEEMSREEELEQESDVEIVIPDSPGLGNKVIHLKGVSHAFEERTLFAPFDFDVVAGMKLGIVGRNGCGKTTLIRILTGAIRPETGSVEVGSRVSLNLVDQNREQISDEHTVVEEVGEGRDFVSLGGQQISIRSYLRRFLFDEDRMNQKIGNLSGGERSRVLLAKMMRRGGNVLVLDEPTNDLDLSTLRVLEESLARFDGTVITVSHDRYFLDRVCTHILSIDSYGNVHCDVGNYSEYKERHHLRFQVVEPVASRPVRDVRRIDQVPKLTWKEERELEAMENNILDAERAVEALERLMCDPLFLVERRVEIASTNTRLEEARAQVQSLYARWEALEEKRRLHLESKEVRQG
jgi:ATP-binding cassette subfamily F protein uup